MAHEQNMMLYRSIFTLSLKLLTLFLVVRLVGYAATGRGHAYPEQIYYPTSTIDVSHNPGATIAGQQPVAVAGSAVAAPGVILTAGSAPAVAASGGYLTPAATNPRPSFLFPRLRFGLRHPPLQHPHPRHPMAMANLGPVSHHNMGQQTHVVETHSHLYSLPDGTQVRVPMATKPQTSVKVSTSSTSSDETPSETSSSTTEKPNADLVSITNEEPAKDVSQVAERRTSLASSAVYREKQYNDWSLHFNPGS